MMSSTLGLTCLMTPYAHLALLMMLTLLYHMTLVGVGMWVCPVKTRRPNFGVFTISGTSPRSQKAGSSSFRYFLTLISVPEVAVARAARKGPAHRYTGHAVPRNGAPWKIPAL